MASVPGSQLTFVAPDKEHVNLILSDGKTVSGTTVKGAFNIEVFTVAPGTAMSGVDGTAFIEGAVKVDSNTVQAGSRNSEEQLGFGGYTLIDETRGGDHGDDDGHDGRDHHKARQGENIDLGSGAQTVIGSSGDTITGGNAGSGLQVIDLTGRNHDVTSGPMTAIGGAGSLVVEAGSNDSITGGSGPTTVLGGMLDGSGNGHGRGHSDDDDEHSRGDGDDHSNGKGKSDGGNHHLIRHGGGDTITGGSGSLSVGGGIGGATITAGTGGTTVDGGNGDVISNPGSGTLLVDIYSRDAQPHSASTMGSGTETVDLSKGHGATTLRDISVAGHRDHTAETSVTGFSTTTDTIASATSVDSTGTFLGNSKSSGGNTTLTFLDGSKMTLVGVSDINKIHFTQ